MARQRKMKTAMRNRGFGGQDAACLPEGIIQAKPRGLSEAEGIIRAKAESDFQ